MEPRRRRKRLSHPAPLPTSIDSLGDDILRNILFRLPSLASVARAALACSRWRRLATCREFLRQFRDLHPSGPLLGCFVSFISDHDEAFRAFHRAQICSDRDVATAVRGGDFLLAGLEDERQWRIRDCSHGVLLLASTWTYALFNPVSRRRINLSRPTGYHEFDNRCSFHSCFLPDCGGDGARLPSFRLVSLEANFKSQLRAHVYSSNTGKWKSHPWCPPSIQAPAPSSCFHDQSPYPSMHVAGRIFWKYQEGKVLLSLDTSSMEFSHVALPPMPDLYRPQAMYAVGDTEDGACCLVCIVSDRSLQVWRRNKEAGSWKLVNQVYSFGYGCNLNLPQVRQVCAVTAGVVLFCVDHASVRCRYTAFRLKDLFTGLGERRELADFITCSGLAAYPYLLTWPSFSLQQPPDRLARWRCGK